jgi:hypothetical protein
MNLTDAANWVCQHWVDETIVTVAVVAAELGRRAYKAHRESYRASEEMGRKYATRTHNRPQLPPHSLRR